MNCPDCKKQMCGVEYSYKNSQRYDGISEWICKDCNIRIGRWSGKRLESQEFELRYGVNP